MAFIFTGLDEYSVDDRGRMLLPPAYKPALTDTVVIGIGTSEQIWVYPKPTYQKYLEKLDATPFEERNASFYEAHRMILEGQHVDFDKQGRISIPPLFRRVSGITNAVIVAGNGDRVELWQPERYLERRGLLKGEPAKFDDNPVFVRTGFHL
jgi:MraZ protein